MNKSSLNIASQKPQMIIEVSYIHITLCVFQPIRFYTGKFTAHKAEFVGVSLLVSFDLGVSVREISN